MEDLNDPVNETGEDNEIPVSPPASRATVRAKNKKSLGIKKTVKTIPPSKSTKQSNTKKSSSSKSTSIPNKVLHKSKQTVVPISSGSEEEIEEGRSQISNSDNSNEEGCKKKRGDKKGPSKRDPEIDNIEFELHWRSHFEEKDVDKNVEFKKMKGGSYDVHFSFAQFLEKQIDKARVHAIETFGMNTPCQMVKV